ncbi:hypothetical protein HGA34_00485 [Candidatus Falkowbacteria bacterium]|nr:hypothetical protein [Candidatus Falkowbacteria bacterium]
MNRPLFGSAIAVFSLFLSLAFSPGQAAAQTAEAKCDPIKLEFVFRNPKGDFLPNVNVELWCQTEDADRNPVQCGRLAGGKTSSVSGKATVTYTPPKDAANKTIMYALKVYDKNPEVANFWYFNELNLSCGQELSVTKVLPGIRFVFRDQDGNLKKNVKFSLYTQRYDIENRPINEKKDLVTSDLDTGATGEAYIFVTDKSHAFRQSGGDYVLNANLGGSVGYIENYLHVNDQMLTEYEYVFTDMVLIAEDANGKLIPAGKTLEFYEQKQDVKGKLILGKSIKRVTIDSKGEVLFEYPAGTYAVVMKDDLGNTQTFWNITLERYKRERKKLVTNVTRFDVKDAAGKAVINKAVQLYGVTQDYKGDYFRGTRIGQIMLTEKGYGEAILAPGKYLFTISLPLDRKIIEYGRVFTIESGKLQKLTLKAQKDNVLETGKILPAPGTGPIAAIAKKLSGYILLQTESKGEAWYVYGTNSKRYYMADGSAAYQAMRKLGLGITNNDLSKIPIGIRSDIGGFDTDGDGLANQLEEAIGTDSANSDTDGDGYQDSNEFNNGFNPLGSGKLNYDLKFASRLKGKILLQTESKGEAWYVNPKDGKRYYLANGDAAYQIMRLLSLGISNQDLEQIGEATIQ